MPLRCLIVDDNAGFRGETRAPARRAGHCGVGHAAVGIGGDQADRRSTAEHRAHRHDIDINLGGESGFALTQTLAESIDGARPTVILVATP
jgi:hypothetical protein